MSDTRLMTLAQGAVGWVLWWTTVLATAPLHGQRQPFDLLWSLETGG